ncbi:MAG TPA: carboxypeptidase regulatory-like domain-containing protein [Acidobacteriaceae bacterium]
MKRLISLFCVVLSSALCLAQTSTGSITGQIHDSMHLPVTNVTVIIANPAMNFLVKVKTNSSGVYSSSSLQPGVYTITAERDGFERVQIDNVSVDPGGTVTNDFNLRVGKSDIVVNVNANDEGLSTTSATIATTVTRELAIDIPLAERSALSLVTLSGGVQGDPQYSGGVQSENPGIYTQPNTPGASLSISGGRPGSVSHLMDGFDITQSGYPRAGITFSSTSISGITIMQNGLPAQYGRSGGGIINQASASGTNTYHGILIYRHLDPYFENTPYGSISAPAHHQTLITVAAGGPVPIRYWGLNRKSFFYASFEPLRNTDQQFVRRRLFTPDELAGRLHNSFDLLDTDVLKNSGYAAAIAAPRKNTEWYQFNRNTQGFPIGKQFTSTSLYQQIPNDDVSAQVAANPVAQYIFSRMPTPDNPGPYAHFNHADASYDADGLNGYGARGSRNTDNRYLIRWDQEFTGRDHVFARYASVPVTGNRFDYLGPNSEMGAIFQDKVSSQNIAISYTHIFTGNTVNEARVSYLRANRYRGGSPTALTKDWGAALGLAPAVSGVGFPQINFSGTIGQIGSGGAITDAGRSLDVNFGVGDDVSIQKGAHTIRFGFDYRALQLNRTDNSDLGGGQYNFSAGYTGKGSAAAGSSIATFDLGIIPSLAVRQSQPYYYRWKYGAAYIQDDWRALAKLTVNYGIRYNVETPRMEKFNIQGIFLPNAAGTYNGTGTYSSVPATGGFAYSTTNGTGKTLWPVNYKSFEPRVGLSYQLNRKMTIRSAYSLIHTPLTGISNSVVPDLSASAVSIGSSGAGGVDPNSWVNYITNPVATPITLPGVAHINQSLVETYNASSYLPYIEQNDTVPYVQLWSLSFQMQVTSATVMEIDYSGQKGTHLYSTPRAFNSASLNKLIADVKANTNFSGTSTNAYGYKVTGQQAERPYQQFYNNPIMTAFERNASSSYNGVYMNVRHRARAGLMVLGSFTWAKSMDDASAGNLDTISTDVFGFAHPQTPYGLQGEHSLSTFDIPVKTAVAYVWNLPFGRGSLIGNSVSRTLNMLVGGWTTSGTFSVQSGYPLWVVAGNASSNPGFFISNPTTLGSATTDLYLRPNINPGIPLIRRNWKNDPYGINTGGGGYLNPDAFSMPGSLGDPQLGNAPRTLGGARNPRTIYLDMSLRKQLTLGSRFKLTLMTDVTNVMNHSNFFLGSAASTSGVFTSTVTTTAGVATYARNPNFGKLGQSFNLPARSFMLGGRLQF